MKESTIEKLKEITFGILLGVYGNIMVGFIDRVEFPNTMNNNSISITLFILAYITTFILYIIFSYANEKGTEMLWVIHAIIPLFVFIIQETYATESNFIGNLVYFLVQSIFLVAIFTGEGMIFGRSIEKQLNNRWKYPVKIGIFSDMNWNTNNTEIFTWTHISIEDWINRINKMSDKINVEKIKITDDFDEYPVIINPYGGVYPEEDLKKLSTFKHILDYVNKGGVFTNVADVPTYWAYNDKIKRKIDNTRPIYVMKNNKEILTIRPFSLTPLVEELGLAIINTDSNPVPQDLSTYGESDLKFNSKRICKVESNVISCIETYKIEKEEYTSLFFIKYGEGDFLISLFYLNDEMYDAQHKIVFKNAIISNILDKIEEKRSILKIST